MTEPCPLSPLEPVLEALAALLRTGARPDDPPQEAATP